MLAKKEIIEAIAGLPDAVSSEQLMDAVDRLVFLEEARQGLEDVRQGRVYNPEQIREALEL